MANIRIDVLYEIKDGTEIVFRSPVDCSKVTGLIVYYTRKDGNTTSREFAFADAHGNNVGDIPYLFAENVVVKVILDVTTGMAFVQNADTNAYIERTFAKKKDSATAIINTADGKVVSVSDSVNRPLHGLKLYGKTTQSGTPAPDAPIPLVSAGNGGNIYVTVAAAEESQTLEVYTTADGLPGIPVDDGWISDEVDLGRGVYVQRVQRLELNGSEGWLTANTIKGVNILYLQPTFPLAAAEAGLCTHFPYDRAKAYGGQEGYIGAEVSNVTGKSRLWVSTTMTVAEFKAFLAEHPVTMMYPMAEPVGTALDDDLIAEFATLHSYKPNTTVTNDAGAEMQLEYVADTKTYVDNHGNGGSSEPGADGFSPIATVEQTADGVKITITDKTGTTEAVVTNGKDGEKGEKGDTGAQGPQGEKGETGSQGVQGIQGEKGDKGDTGATGPQGATGPKGDTGAQGPVGPQGEQGIQGEPGAKGDKGDPGADGAKGEKGDTGSAGKDGVSATHSWNGTVLSITSASGTTSADLKGEKGETGETGQQGPKGDKGDKGDTGAAGTNGKDGVSATHSWNGTTLTITSASGTSSADLKGAKGDKGDQGIQGVKGDTGATGPKGDTGAQGPKGDTGATGATGPAGKTPVYGVDYGTPAQIEEIVQQVITALGTPVFGRVDENKVITLTGALSDGTYTFQYEDEYGATHPLGSYTKEPEPTYTNILPLSIGDDGAVFNGTGYIDGYRLTSNYNTNAPHYVSAQSGYFTTGFFPYTIDDCFDCIPFYVKGVNLDTISDYARMAMYTDHTATYNNAHTASLNYTTDSGFTITKLGEQYYKITPNKACYTTGGTSNGWNSKKATVTRLSLPGSGAGVILTINEPID